MVQPKMGIAALTTLVQAIGAASKAGSDILGDGEISIGDLRFAKEALVALATFKAVDWKSVLPETKDLDDAERGILADAFDRVFVLPPELKTAEQIVEAGFGYLLLILDAIMPFLGLDPKIPFKVFAAKS